MPGGVIVIRNGGGYIARFSVRFINDERKHITRESGIFTVGVNKSIEFPSESKDIIVKAEAMWGLGWSTIFTKEFSAVPLQFARNFICEEQPLTLATGRMIM